MHPKARVALVHFTANDPAKAANYYSKMFGIQFARISSPTGDTFTAPVSATGCTVVISKPYRQVDGTTVYFAVENISQAVSEIQTSGGKLVLAPQDMKTQPNGETLGSYCEVIDEFGNHYGLIQYSHAVNQALGKPANQVTLSPHTLAAHMAALDRQ